MRESASERAAGAETDAEFSRLQVLLAELQATCAEIHGAKSAHSLQVRTFYALNELSRLITVVPSAQLKQGKSFSAKTRISFLHFSFFSIFIFIFIFIFNCSSSSSSSSSSCSIVHLHLYLRRQCLYIFICYFISLFCIVLMVFCCIGVMFCSCYLHRSFLHIRLLLRYICIHLRVYYLQSQVHVHFHPQL